jgi:hypothetical protein
MKELFTFTISKKESNWLDNIKKTIKPHLHLLPRDEDGLIIDRLCGLLNQYDWLVENKIIKKIKQ